MELLTFVRLVVVLVTMVSGDNLTREKMRQLSLQSTNRFWKDPQKGEMMCAKLSEEPYFGVEMLLGKPWRIYYSWNMDLQNQCLDMSFKNATPAMVNGMYNDMNEFLETEPYWDAATVMVRMGQASHEMLLFADQGAAGRFQGVPNIVRDGSISPPRQTVPLLRFHLKLLYGGKYLLMGDCQMGVTTLSARRKNLPYRTEISGIISKLDFGSGFHTCQSNKNKK